MSREEIFGLSLWGYSEMIRPVWSPIRSTTGFAICFRPWNVSTLPKNTAWVPTGSWRSRQPWLKKFTRMKADPSPTSAVTSTLGGRPRVRRLEMRATVPTTITSSPGSTSRIVRSLERSMWRRG
jgi:hypothetical protein